MFDLGPKARVVFAAAYLSASLALVGYGLWTPDHVFGFQMFNESSRIRVRLFREVRGAPELVPAPGGAWQARDAAGTLRTFRWNDRVRYSALSRLDVFVHASYGLDAQIFRLQAALDDVGRHLPGDAETVALVAIVERVKNGRALEPLTLVGARR